MPKSTLKHSDDLPVPVCTDCTDAIATGRPAALAAGIFREHYTPLLERQQRQLAEAHERRREAVAAGAWRREQADLAAKRQKHLRLENKLQSNINTEQEDGRPAAKNTPASLPNETEVD